MEKSNQDWWNTIGNYEKCLLKVERLNKKLEKPVNRKTRKPLTQKTVTRYTNRLKQYEAAAAEVKKAVKSQLVARVRKINRIYWYDFNRKNRELARDALFDFNLENLITGKYPLIDRSDCSLSEIYRIGYTLFSAETWLETKMKPAAAA